MHKPFPLALRLFALGLCVSLAGSGAPSRSFLISGQTLRQQHAGAEEIHRALSTGLEEGRSQKPSSTILSFALTAAIFSAGFQAGSYFQRQSPPPTVLTSTTPRTFPVLITLKTLKTVSPYATKDLLVKELEGDVNHEDSFGGHFFNPQGDFDMYVRMPFGYGWSPAESYVSWEFGIKQVKGIESLKIGGQLIVDDGKLRLRPGQRVKIILPSTNKMEVRDSQGHLLAGVDRDDQFPHRIVSFQLVQKGNSDGDFRFTITQPTLTITHPASVPQKSGLEEWDRRVAEYYHGANVAVIGGSGFVGGDYLKNLLDQHGANVASVRALTRNPNRFNRDVYSEIPGAQKLALETGDHLSSEAIQRSIRGAKLVVDTAGLAWQHLPGGVPATLTDELLQNAMSAGLIGLLLADDQRLVWTSSNASDYMFARLTEANQGYLMREIYERAADYVSWLKRQPNLAVSEKALRSFIQANLASLPPQRFVPEAGREPVSFADEYSYPYSKLLGQQILQLIARGENKDIRVLKISDVYGPGQGLGQAYWDPAFPGGRLAARRLQRFIAVAEAIRLGEYQPWLLQLPQDGFSIEDGMLHQTVYNDYAAPTHVRDVVEMIHRVATLDASSGPRKKVVFNVAAPWIPNDVMADAVINAVNAGQERDRTIDVVVVPNEQPILRQEPANASGDLVLLGMREGLTPLDQGIGEWLAWWRSQAIAQEAVLPPISLEEISGLPIQLSRPGNQILGQDNRPWGNLPDLRTAGAMKEVLADPSTVKTPPATARFATDETVEYSMYRDRVLPEDRSSAAASHLRYDVTVIAPSDDLHRFGTELVKTYGHYHPPRDPQSWPEVYEVLFGEAWFLLQKPSPTDPGIIEDIILVKAKAGEKAVMLPGYGHITINPSATQPIVMANWVSSAFSSAYELYRDHRGGAVYISRTPDSPGQLQIAPNPIYKVLPPHVRIARPAPELPAFGLQSGVPMYPLIRVNPGQLDFLNTPEKFKSEFAQALNQVGQVPVGGVMAAAGLEEKPETRSLVGQDGRVVLPLRQFQTPEEIGRYQANQVMQLWRSQVDQNKNFVMGLPTGSTPQPFLKELVAQLQRLSEAERSRLVNRVYVVAMDDIVQNGHNVPPDHGHSAHQFFRQYFFDPVSQMPPMAAQMVNGWVDEHLFVPTVGRVAEQVNQIIRLGGVQWQLMATDPVEGHVGEVPPGERFGDPEVLARANQPRTLSGLFLQHNPWAQGYEGISLLLDHYVQMLAEDGVVSFAVFGQEKADVLERFAQAQRYQSSLPISFLWLEQWGDKQARIEVLSDSAAAAKLPADAGLEELGQIVTRARNQKAVYIFGPSISQDVLEMVRALQDRGLTQVLVLEAQEEAMQRQLDGKVLEWARMDPLPELFVYASEGDLVAGNAIERLKSTSWIVYPGGGIDDAEQFFQSLLGSLGVPQSYLRENWQRLFQSLQSAASLETSV